MVQDPPTKHKHEKSAWNSHLAISCTKKKEQHFFCALTTPTVWKQFTGTACAQTALLGKKRARNCLQRALNRVSTGEEAALPPHLGGAHVWGIGSLNSRLCLENRAEKWGGRSLVWERPHTSYVQNECFIQRAHPHVGTTSLLHAATLSLVWPGCQTSGSDRWRSESIPHRTSLQFPSHIPPVLITHPSIPHHTFPFLLLAFCIFVCVFVLGIFWINAKENIWEKD